MKRIAGSQHESLLPREERLHEETTIAEERIVGRCACHVRITSVKTGCVDPSGKETVDGFPASNDRSLNVGHDLQQTHQKRIAERQPGRGGAAPVSAARRRSSARCSWAIEGSNTSRVAERASRSATPTSVSTEPWLWSSRPPAARGRHPARRGGPRRLDRTSRVDPRLARIAPWRWPREARVALPEGDLVTIDGDKATEPKFHAHMQSDS